MLPTAVDNDYYTVVLSNQDYTLFGPVVYQMVGNVKGSDLKDGKFNYDEVPAPATEIIPWTQPAPPFGYTNYHYSYLVFKQTDGVVDYSQASTSDWWWDATDFATQYNLELVTSNYFVGKSDPLAGLIFLILIILS